MDFHKGDPKATRIVQGSTGQDLYTTEISIFETATGIYRMTHNPSRALTLTNIMLKNLHILELDRTSTLKAAELRADLLNKGKPIQPTDCLIAGIALAHGINQIVTLNKTDFERIPGLSVLAY